MGPRPIRAPLTCAQRVGFALALALTVDGGPPPTPDAGPMAEAPPVDLDAGPPPDAAGDAGIDAAAVLRHQIDALRELVAGRLPPDVEPESLFGVDLDNEDAVSARCDVIEARLGTVAPPAPDAGVDEPSPDAEVDLGLDGAVSEAGIEDAGVAPAMDAGSADDLDAAAPPDEVVLDGAVIPLEWVEPPLREPAATDEIEALERERDRLRLRFLRMPLAERSRLLHASRERRRIAVEEQASQVDADRATEDARRAIEASSDLFDRAAAAEDAAESSVLAERARLEQARADLARWELRLARSRQTEAHAQADRLQLAHRLQSLVVSASAQEADHTYDELVTSLVDLRARLDQLLDALSAPSDVPTFELRIDPDASAYSGFDEARNLRTAAQALERDATRAAERQRDLRWTWIDSVAEDLRALDQLRVALIPRLGQRRREQLLGLGPEGRAQLSRELTQARVMMRYWGRNAWHDLPEWPARFGALFYTSSSRNEVAFAIALALLIVLVWRRREPLTERLRVALFAQRGGRGWAGLIRPFWAVVGPLVIPVAVLITLHLLLALIDDLTDSIAVDVLRVVVTRVAWFLVLVTAAVRFFVSRLRHGAGRASIARKVVGSVRLVLGFGLCVVITTDLSELVLGQGYLYGLVVDLAWLGAAPIALILVHRWSDTVCDAHRDRWPKGVVDRVLGRSDTRLRRYALTVPAAAQLAVYGSYTALKELVLRFDQARRAFAFLFRRRLERQVERRVDESQIAELPKPVRVAFAEHPSDRELEIDFFPDIDRVADRVRAFVKGDTYGFALALVGERGIGKTTWLRELAARVDGRVDTFEVPHRLIDPSSVVRWISEQLEVPPTDQIDELAESLDALTEPRVVALDNCQNLVVRAIGGAVGLETLVEIAARANTKVVWVCSFARYTWRYLERARQGQDLFREHVDLEPWPEEKIAQLIRARMTRAGLEASFRDLVVDELAGNALEDAVLRTQDEYLRLLWDFASGNPRVALHYWKHSLVERDGALSVQLFAAPIDAALDELHDQSRFLLATIALHENATLHEAAESVGISSRQTFALLTYLKSLQYVAVDKEGYWRLSTHWYRAVVRHLKRQRLLFDR